MINNLKSKKRLNIFSFCLFFFFFSVLTAHGQSFQDHFQAAVFAYEDGEYTTMLKEFSEAHASRPEHPTIIYNLAMGYAVRIICI